MKTLEFPSLRQTFEYDCGANAIQSVLVYYGIEYSESILMKEANTSKRYGTYITDVENVFLQNGLQVDSRSFKIEDVVKYIDNNIPVLLLLQAWSGVQKTYIEDYEDGHWVVAIGYDDKKIYFSDPYAFNTVFLSYEELLNRWHGLEHGTKITNHAIAVFGKKATYDSHKTVHMG